jgi:hypothetical protein
MPTIYVLRVRMGFEQNYIMFTDDKDYDYYV